jgi:hypothetical protein
MFPESNQNEEELIRVVAAAPCIPELAAYSALAVPPVMSFSIKAAVVGCGSLPA